VRIVARFTRRLFCRRLCEKLASELELDKPSVKANVFGVLLFFSFHLTLCVCVCVCVCEKARGFYAPRLC